MSASDPVDDPRPADAPVTATRSTNSGRLISAIVFGVSASILLVAFALTPNTKDGVGTHTAMGLPPCGLEEATGIPCATCGMTTSFSLAVHGDLAAAFTNQPAGALLAVLTAMAVVLSGYAFVTGMSLAPIGAVIWQPRVVVIGAVILLIAWAYKIVIHTGMFGVDIGGVT
jgi:predicted anti-sigma-YlaC factor YlaD